MRGGRWLRLVDSAEKMRPTEAPEKVGVVSEQGAKRIGEDRGDG